MNLIINSQTKQGMEGPNKWNKMMAEIGYLVKKVSAGSLKLDRTPEFEGGDTQGDLRDDSYIAFFNNTDGESPYLPVIRIVKSFVLLSLDRRQAFVNASEIDPGEIGFVSHGSKVSCL